MIPFNIIDASLFLYASYKTLAVFFAALELVIAPAPTNEVALINDDFKSLIDKAFPLPEIREVTILGVSLTKYPNNNIFEPVPKAPKTSKSLALNIMSNCLPNVSISAIAIVDRANVTNTLIPSAMIVLIDFKPKDFVKSSP